MLFATGPNGEIFNILDSYSSFQDPGALLNIQITQLTGITDEMIKNQVIDRSKLEKVVQPASIIIAHNAEFDRKFVEKQFPIFKQKAWGCSYKQVPWKKNNISSAKLEYLAYTFGFFYDAHRAEMDCLVGIHLLTQMLPISKQIVLKSLLSNIDEKTYVIWATNSPFSTKELLKARGYRWNDGSNGKPKSWYIEVNESQKVEELNFLEQNIYQNKREIEIEEINSLNRFSTR